jgi:hypothetical protein
MAAWRKLAIDSLTLTATSARLSGHLMCDVLARIEAILAIEVQ